MYISGGENIYPQEIENVLIQHPSILRSLVIPMNDDIWGKKGVAFLETKEEISEQNIREFLKDKLANFKHPKEFVQMKSFPVTGFGKISRKDLKRLYQLQTQNN
jgi:fatty-acyl-CoA synthase